MLNQTTPANQKSKAQVFLRLYLSFTFIFANLPAHAEDSESATRPPVPVVQDYSPEDNDVVSVPSDWLDGEISPAIKQNEVEKARSLSLFEKKLTRYIQLNQDALEEAIPSPFPGLKQNRPEGAPADWAPWHLAFVTTDLSVSASGMIGARSLKGTPAVQLYWKHQEAPTSNSEKMETSSEDSHGTVLIDGSESPAELEQQIDAVVTSLKQIKKIRNPEAFRKNLLQRSQMFQPLSVAAQKQLDQAWWVSGLRMDCLFDLTGRILPWGSLGGEIRIRWDWKRLKKSTPSAMALLKDNSQTALPTSREIESAEKLLSVVSAQLNSVSTLADEGSASNFAAQSFRLGFGISQKGEYALGKGNLSILGHISFNRNPKKKTTEKLSNLKQTSVSTASMIPVLSDDKASLQEISAEKFQAGLRKSLRIGSALARLADRGSNDQSRPRKWKIHEMKVGFDTSLTWKTGIVEVGRLATAEISFINLK